MQTAKLLTPQVLERLRPMIAAIADLSAAMRVNKHTAAQAGTSPVHYAPQLRERIEAILKELDRLSGEMGENPFFAGIRENLYVLMALATDAELFQANSEERSKTPSV